MTDRVELAVPPFVMEIDGADVHFLEIVELKGFGVNNKIATVFVEWNCWRTPPFTVMFTNNDNLMLKLRIEIAKMKSIILSGKPHIYKKVC